MDEVAARETILETLKGKKGKSKFYLKDFYAMFPEEKPRTVKKLLTPWFLKEAWSTGLLEAPP